MLPKDYIQEKAFIRWVNHQLQGTSRSINNLDQDFKDGVNLCFLLETLTQYRQRIPFHKSPNNFSHKTENVHLALSFLTTVMGLKSYGFNAKDVETGNKKTILGLIFQLVNKYQISKVLGLDQDKPSIATAKAKLLSWCQSFSVKGDPTVINFDSSFHNGKVFYNIINHYHSNNPKFVVTDNDFYEPVVVATKCFNFAAENGVPRLLDPEDLWQLTKFDDSAVVLYLSYLYCWLERPPQPVVPTDDSLHMGQYTISRNTRFGTVTNMGVATAPKRGLPPTPGSTSATNSPSLPRKPAPPRPSILPPNEEPVTKSPLSGGSSANLDDAASRAAMEERSALLTGRLKELRRQLVRVRMDSEAEAAREMLERQPRAVIVIETRDDEFDDLSTMLSPTDPKAIDMQVTVCQEKIEMLESQINDLQAKLRRRKSRRFNSRAMSIYEKDEPDAPIWRASMYPNAKDKQGEFEFNKSKDIAREQKEAPMPEPKPLGQRITFFDQRQDSTDGSGLGGSTNTLSSTNNLLDGDGIMSTTELNAILSGAAGGSNLPLKSEEEEVDEYDPYGYQNDASEDDSTEDGTTAMLSEYDLIGDDQSVSEGTPGSLPKETTVLPDPRRSVLKTKGSLVVSIPTTAPNSMPTEIPKVAVPIAPKATLSPAASKVTFKKSPLSSPALPDPLSPKTERSIATQRPLSDLFFRQATQHPRLAPYPNAITQTDGFRIEDGTETVWWLVNEPERVDNSTSSPLKKTNLGLSVNPMAPHPFRKDGSTRNAPSPLATAVAAIAAHRNSGAGFSPSPESPRASNGALPSPTLDGPEGSGRAVAGRSLLVHAPVLENPEYEVKWYQKHFHEREHDVFIADNPDFGPMIIAAVREDYDDLGQNTTTPYRQYRLIIFLKTGSVLFTVPLPEEKPTLTISQLLYVARPDLAETAKNLRSVSYKDIGKTLMSMESAQTASSFKFGVLYVKQGQTKEEDMFANENGSLEFDEFLNIIGDKIVLNGWNKFRGGLDNKNDKTGLHSVYTEFCGHEIMFHVSTLLPYNANDPQQLERKRHIGNDICCIVFDDSPPESQPTFSPTCISSHFLHIFAGIRVVKNEKGEKLYCVNFSCKNDVPEFGPVLPNPPYFNAQQLRQWLLTKLVNAELAACEASTFTTKMVRTLGQLLDNANKEFAAGSKGTKKTKGTKECMATKKVSLVTMRSKTTEVASMNMSHFKSPILLNEMPYEITSMDCLGTNFIIGAVQGLFFYDGTNTTEIKGNKPRKYLQIRVVPELKIIITLGVRTGGKNYIIVFDIDSVIQHVREGTKVKETKVMQSRMTNFFALDEYYNPDRPMYMVASLGKTQLCFLWQSISKSFKKLESLFMGEPCRVLNVSGSMLMMGFQEKFVCVNMDDRISYLVYLPPSVTYGGHIDPRTIVSLPEEFICHYNNVSIFVDKEGKQSRSYVIKWTGVCHSIIYAFPFLVGLMRDRSEIRSLVNGRMVASIPINSYDYLAKTAIPGRGTTIFFSRVYTKKSIISHLDVSPFSALPPSSKVK